MLRSARLARLMFVFSALFALAVASARADVQPAAEAVPPPPAAMVVDMNAADPVVSVARHRRCSSRTIVISPSYSGGELQKSVLFVNGRHMQTITETGRVFSLGVRRFRAGRNNYEVVSIFTSGKSASTIGSFKRCSRRR